jgi:hypothetical protein
MTGEGSGLILRYGLCNGWAAQRGVEMAFVEHSMIENIVCEGVPEQVERLPDRSGSTRRVHLFMLIACSFLLCFAIIPIVGEPSAGWESSVAATAVILIVLSIPAVLWQDRKNYERRDAALTLPWTFALAALVPRIAVLSAHFQFPLRDALLVEMDHAMGFSVPAIMAWSSAHWPMSPLLDHSYNLLFLLLPVAAVLPALLGKRAAAEQFLLANTIAFVVSFPIFALIPAVGPWAGYHFAGSEAQRNCGAASVALHSGSGTAAMAGLVTFPSFHVIWALLSACALWSIRPLRIAAAIVAFLVVLSTVTTGWHYGADVFAGFLIVGVSLFCADWIAGVGGPLQKGVVGSPR